MVSYRDPSGNQHTKTFARRRDAESFARRVEVEKEDGRWSDPAAGRVTVADFWNHFLATSHHLRPTTRALYETHGKYILAAFGSRKLSSIRKPDVKEFVSDLVFQGKGQATVVQVVKLLRRLLQVAVEEERIARNPAQGISVPQPTRRDARYLSADEVDAIAKETPPRYRTLVYFLAYTGCESGKRQPFVSGTLIWLGALSESWSLRRRWRGERQWATQKRGRDEPFMLDRSSARC